MKKTFGKIGIFVLLVMFLAVMFAMPASAASAWKQKVVRFSATAGDTLAVGNVVCIAGSDGYAYKADADDANLRPAVGIIGKGGASGTTVEIVVVGILSGQTAASPGARVFLSATAGALTTVQPTNSQPIGFVMSGATGAATSTTYFIDIKMPSSTGAGY